jgi:hypothetical protein
MTDEREKLIFWESIIRAAEAEPRRASSIRGASGISHPVIAVGVDEGRRRLLIISGEHDARSAAMSHTDIQATLSSFQVVVARPVAVNLSVLAKKLAVLIGRFTLTAQDLQNLQKLPPDDQEWIRSLVEPVIEQIAKPFEVASLNVLPQLMQVLQQLALIQPAIPEPGTWTLDFEKLAQLDPTEPDSRFGVCPLPLYNFSSEEAEVLHSGTDLEAIRELLKRHHVFQYFFPPPDQLALGLIDRSPAARTQILDEIRTAPDLGHPFGPLEIISPDVPILHLIDALQDRGLVVEGDMTTEVTPEGKAIRNTVRWKPREGLLSKLINRLRINLSFKDLFPGR